MNGIEFDTAEEKAGLKPPIKTIQNGQREQRQSVKEQRAAVG